MSGKRLNTFKQNAPFYMKIVKLLTPLYRLIGADAAQVYYIVTVKMMLDKRKESPFGGEVGSGEKEHNQLGWTILFLGIFGLFLTGELFQLDTIYQQFSLFFTILISLTTFMLTTYFSNIILDELDRPILGTRPISHRTISAAKFTHVSIYLTMLVLSLSAGMIVRTALTYSILTTLVLMVLVLITGIFTFILTYVIYIGVLTVFDRYHLQSILLYAKVIMSGVVLMVAFVSSQIMAYIQLVGRSVTINLVWWQMVLVPMWFAAPFDLIEHGLSLSNAIYTGLLLLLIGVSAGLLIVFAERIEQALTDATTPSEHISRSVYYRLSEKLACVNFKERPYFRLYWTLMQRDNTFKTRLYPNLIQGFIWPFGVVISQVVFSEDGFQSIIGQSYLVYTTYLVAFSLVSMTLLIKFSDDYEAKWVYSLDNSSTVVHIFQAMYKALLMRMIMPFYLVIAVLFMCLTRSFTPFIVINGLLFLMVALYFLFNVLVSDLPFSQKFETHLAGLGCAGQVIGVLIILVSSSLLVVIQLFMPFGKFITFVILSVIRLWIHYRGFAHKDDQLNLFTSASN
ncbi:hypothetical protein [Dolosigranulum savutiense]|uniref:ABC transporter permease n=1 Tax=Dolosigranulum savutiense TaxID=3110288 RepID=A0AB74TZU1_9LACT